MRAGSHSPRGGRRAAGGGSVFNADGVVDDSATALPPVTLPPLARSGNPKPGQGRGGTIMVLHGAAEKLAAKVIEETFTVTRSAPSDSSSKAPPLPDRNFTNDFHWTLNSRDLPQDIRPIIEDNKMLQEELRRYRVRLGEQEGLLISKERVIVALRDEVARQKLMLRDCSAISPDELLQDRQFRAQLQDKDAVIQQLQHKAAILEKAKAAAERRLNNDLAAERRAQAELRRQLKLLQEEMLEKQKVSRFNQLHINELYRRLEPLEAAVQGAAAPAPPPVQVAAEERVQLMLCMVYAQPQPTAAEIAEAAARLAAEEAARAAAELRRRQEPAALRIQAAARGFLARRQLARQRAAATAIQAAARGMLARRAVGAQLAERVALQRQAAEQQYRDRLAARGHGGRRSSLAPARGANTAPEAARNRSILVTDGHGGSGGSGGGGGGSGSQPGGSSSGAGPQAARPSFRVSTLASSSGSLLGIPGRSGGLGSISGASPGSTNSSRRSSLANITPAPGPDMEQQVAQQAQQQGKAAAGQPGAQGRAPASTRGDKSTSLLGRGQGAAGQAPAVHTQEALAQLSPALPKTKRPVSLGFASSQARPSFATVAQHT